MFSFLFPELRSVAYCSSSNSNNPLPPPPQFSQGFTPIENLDVGNNTLSPVPPVLPIGSSSSSSSSSNNNNNNNTNSNSSSSSSSSNNSSASMDPSLYGNPSSSLNPGVTPDEIPAPQVTNHPAPTKRGNPGPINWADAAAKRVLNIDAFEGCRIDLSQPLGNFFVTSHRIAMAPATGQPGVQSSTYQFGANAMVGDTLLISSVDQSGRVGAKWNQKYNERWDHSIHADLSPNEEESSVTADFECKGEDFTGGLKIGTGLVLGMSYFQSVTPTLAFGGEGIWHSGKRQTIVYGRARYYDNNYTACLTAGTMGTVSANFLRRVNDRVSLATEIEFAPSTLDAYVSVGYEFVFRQARLQGNMSSSGILTFSVSDMIAPSVNITCTSQLNHWEDSHKFGVGIQWG